MHKVLIDRPLHPDALQMLSQRAEVLQVFDDDREKITEALRKADGVICSAALKMREPEISLGSNLKVIGRPGVGYDSVDIGAATKAGVPVVYTPDAPTESVAEHVIGLMIMLAKKIPAVEKAFRSGNFGIRTQVTGMELLGKTLGLIGAGRIGKRTAEIAALGLGMNIVIYDPFLKREDLNVPWNYELTDDLASVLQRADFVSIHIPFSEDTKQFIGADEFRMMKKSAYFINTARGGVVHEKALYEALTNGTIAGAGLDVYEKEPPEPDNPLLDLENVVLTPHLSSFTDDGKRKMGIGVVQGVLDVLGGKVPEFLINREVWDKRKT